MKLQMKYGFIMLLMVAVLQSCQNDQPGLTRNVTGRAGELIVVMSDDSWNSNPGSRIRQSLAQEHPALPQDEPIFDLVRVPAESFKSMLRTTRNILQARVSPNLDEFGVVFQENLWATPQAVVTIQAKDEQEFEKLFNEYEGRIINYFLKAERDRLTMNYDRYFERSVFNVLNDKFGITMKAAPGFQIAEDRDDFLWMRYETPEIAQGIIVYTFPYVSDSAFTVNYQIKMRDSILRANVPGPTEGSYMATETRIDQVYNVRPHNGNYATEMRGLWRLMNDFMGGPYLSLAELDLENQRVIVAFGYVYAPGKDKRNFLRQMEAMIYSMKLNNQANNDKLNSQMQISG